MGMWLLPIISIAALAGAINGAFIKDEVRPAGIIVNLVVALIPAGWFWLLYTQKKAKQRFLLWLLQHVDEVRQSKATYEGIPITPNTVIRRYQSTVSIVVMTFRYYSQYYIEAAQTGATTRVTQSYRASKAVGVAYTFLALIFGWWGIPWGPIWTLQTIGVNMSGGVKQSVGDLLATIENAEE